MEDPKNQPSRPEYSNLEHVTPYDAPEVVPGTSRPLERNSSMNLPQWTPPPQQKPQYDYYGTGPEVRPYYEPEKKPVVDDREAEKQAINDQRRMKMCGMRPKVFFWILGVVVVVLILAAVLGGVLGSMLGGSDDSSQSGNAHNASLPSIQSKTGLAAVIPDGSSTTYQYYQDEKGRIIENRYYDGKWLIQGKNIPSYSIVGTDAQSGTPIAATSWSNSDSGTLFRQVFYLDDSGRVMSSNTTGINGWPTPYNILPDDSAMPGSKALSVIADTNTGGLNGLRVYFASSDKGYMRECGLDFGVNPWTLWAEFGSSDPYSGVAAVLQDTVNHVYLVNSSSGVLTQWTWDYSVNLDTSWKQTAKGSSYIAGESDIAAVYDGVSTDHIFYEGSNGKLTRALSYGETISNVKALTTLEKGSKISAAYDSSKSNNGATVYFQSQNDPSEIQYETISRSGETLQSGTVD